MTFLVSRRWLATGLLIMLVSCGESEALERAKQEFQQASEKVQAVVSEQLDAWSGRMEDLDGELAAFREAATSKMAEMGEASRAKLEAALSALEARREDLAAEMAKARAASGEAWDEVSAGFEQAWADLQAAYADAQEAAK